MFGSSCWLGDVEKNPSSKQLCLVASLKKWIMSTSEDKSGFKIYCIIIINNWFDFGQK